MKKWILGLAIILCLAGGVGIYFGVTQKNSLPSPFGTWWWNDTLDASEYLDFACDNGISEIYFCTRKFNDNTQEFISQANAKNIKVYLLAGKHEYLKDDSTLLELIDKYSQYQASHKGARFSGIHLDIEPHQSSEFKSNRYELIYNLIDLAGRLKEGYRDITFDYDIPFWLHDEITYKGQTKPAYEFMIDIADRVFVMSYRDSSAEILKIAKEELAYAKQTNNPLVLCVETNSSEGDNVSFKEEGKSIMMQEIAKVKEQIPSTFGIAIHHIKTWRELKEF